MRLDDAAIDRQLPRLDSRPNAASANRHAVGADLAG
jgi:hypothetical protein